MEIFTFSIELVGCFDLKESSQKLPVDCDPQNPKIFALMVALSCIHPASTRNLTLEMMQTKTRTQDHKGYAGMSIQFEFMETGKSNLMVWAMCLWLSALVSMTITGCGHGGSKSGPDYPVKGRVLLGDGKPLHFGRVVFVSSDTALSYVGHIGDDGGFELKQGDRVGAPAGNYRVRIEIDETSLPKGRGKTARLPFPARYQDEDVSKLAATVKADAATENAFEFKLSK